MHVLVQALDDVAAVVDLAALDDGGDAEGVAGRPGQRLGATDDKPAGAVWRC
jgi:hypothetical protein